MKTIVNRGTAASARGRIVRSLDSVYALHSKITGSATEPVNQTAGFSFLGGAVGQLRITAKGIPSGGVKLSLRSFSTLSSEDLNLVAGDSTVLSTRPHNRLLRSVSTDKPIGTGGSIELDYLISNAVGQSGDKQDRLYGVLREDVEVDGSATAYTSGDEGVLVELAESMLQVGKYLVPNAQGQARYFDPMADTGAEKIGRIESGAIIETIEGVKYVRIRLAIAV